MKQLQKEAIRRFIVNHLYEMDDLRLKLDELAESYDMNSLEVMEFFEQEMERINKLFNYPDN